MFSRSQIGVSLIEVMVALVVLSIGLMGLSLLQMRALQSTHSAYQATLASVIASDAEERLWLARGLGVVDAAAVAQIEEEWLEEWSPVLPGIETESSIDIEDATSSLYQVIVSWTDARFVEEQEFTYRVMLP